MDNIKVYKSGTYFPEPIFSGTDFYMLDEYFMRLCTPRVLIVVTSNTMYECFEFKRLNDNSHL